MKYIIVPIYKTVGLIFFLFVMYPLVYGIGFIWVLWHFDIKRMKDVLDGDFSNKDGRWKHTGEKYYAYKTVWDWYLDRKDWRTRQTNL